MDEITTGELARLFDVTRKTIADLGKRQIIIPGTKRGTWQRDASITGYLKHLRAEGAGRGCEAGQSARGELAAAAETDKGLWTSAKQHSSGETQKVTLIDLIHEGQDILMDGRGRKIERFAGRCAAWTHEVEGALQTDPLSLSRFRRAERSTITTGVPSNIMAEWQITRGRVDALIEIVGEASKREPWRFWVALLVGFVIGAISTLLAAVVLPSDRIDAVRAAVHNIFNSFLP